MHSKALSLYTRASLASCAKHSDVLRHINDNYAATVSGTFHAASVIDSTFTTLDNFNDFAFQCIEAETYGFTCDHSNGVIYVLDCSLSD